MKNIAISLLLAAALAFVAGVVHAQAPPASYPLLDFQHRLSLGGRLYRSFDEKPGVAGSYSSSWWAGIPAAYIITGRQTASGAINPLPLSVIGALDVGLQGDSQRRVRGYLGFAVLFKGTE